MTGYMVAHLSKAVGRGGTVVAIDAEAATGEYLAKRGAELGPARVVTQKVSTNDPELQPASVGGVFPRATFDRWTVLMPSDSAARCVMPSRSQT